MSNIDADEIIKTDVVQDAIDSMVSLIRRLCEGDKEETDELARNVASGILRRVEVDSCFGCPLCQS